jgi:uncharacterized protein (UPF0332 family)
MIKPHDLMALADRLAAIKAETEGRAAVGRAYYCAFHRAKSLVEDGCGIVLPGGAEVHKKLQFCLEQSQNAEVVEIGDRLQSLREERNRADYKLADSTFAKPANVQIQLEKAKAIVAQVEATAVQVASFRSAVRAYATDVLKLRVTTLEP